MDISVKRILKDINDLEKTNLNSHGIYHYIYDDDIYDDDSYLDYKHHGRFNRYGINHTPQCVERNHSDEECVTNHEYYKHYCHHQKCSGQQLRCMAYNFVQYY